MGFNLGTFAGGLSKGANDVIDMWNKIDESKYRKEEIDEKRRIRKANEDFAKDLETLRTERREGSGSFEDLLSDDVRNSRTQQAGIATPGAETPQPRTGSKNPLLDGGEGLYRNQKLADDRYYNRLADIQERLYSVVDPAKAVLVREQLAELRDKDFERTRKTATAALLAGHPNALSLANKAYGFQKDGFQIDTTSGKFDPNTGWSGVNIVDKDGKVTQTMNLTSDDIMKMYFASTPDQLVDFNMKSRDMQIKEEKLPFEKDSLAASASKDRGIGDYYRVAKGSLDSANIDQKIESAFKPYLDAREKVETYMDPVARGKVQEKNAQIESQVGTAIEFYRDPANKNIKSSGSSMEASRALHTIGIVPDPKNAGKGALDISKFHPLDPSEKYAETHYVYQGSGGGFVYVPKGRVDNAIARARALNQNKK